MAHATVEMDGVKKQTPAHDPTFVVNPKIKTECRIALCPQAVYPNMKDWTQHWGLTAAFNGLAAYQNWVSGYLLPVAYLWIMKNKREICERNHWGNTLPDDLHKVVKAAFEYAAEQHSFDDGFQLMPGNLERDGINGTWADIAKGLRETIQSKCEYPDFERLLPRREFSKQKK